MTHYTSCEHAIRDAASGNASALIWCFPWWRSPEGQSYWHRQYIAGHVTPAAKHKLRLRLRRIQRAKRVQANRLPEAKPLTEFLTHA